MKISRLIPLLLLFLLLLSLPVGAEVIKEIKIVGLKWTKEELVRKELLLKEGEEFSDRLLKLSIRNLLNTHLFYEVIPEISKTEEGVKLTLELKERFPIVPIPRFRSGSGGAYRAGFELRDYNFGGMGHKLFAGFSRWYNTDDPSERGVFYFGLYRILSRVTVGLGFNYYKGDVSRVVDGEYYGEYREEAYDIPLLLTYYLDPMKVGQLSIGIEHKSFRREVYPDRVFNFIVLRWLSDRSTDMVYYLKGHKILASVELAEPVSSSYFTGSVAVSACRSVPFKGLRTLRYRVSAGSKFGYSKEFQLNSGIPGFSEEEVVNRRFASLVVSYRFPVYRKNVFLEPVAVMGDSFKTVPDDFLLSAGLRLEVFWERLVDGIISFTCYRGLGANGEFNSSFKFGFRW